jgi:Arc/MetJ-type ribon-helix-helix transcriptional regulator
MPRREVRRYLILYEALGPMVAVRDALRDWRMRRKIETLEIEELRRLVQEGIDSGPGLDADAVFARLRARFGQPPVA